MLRKYKMEKIWIFHGPNMVPPHVCLLCQTYLLKFPKCAQKKQQHLILEILHKRRAVDVCVPFGWHVKPVLLCVGRVPWVVTQITFFQIVYCITVNYDKTQHRIYMIQNFIIPITNHLHQLLMGIQTLYVSKYMSQIPI